MELYKKFGIVSKGWIYIKNDFTTFFRLSQKYKFYLAFENSVCDQYVTEKLHRTLGYPTVPIVLGGASYKDIVPPNSFIDVFEFESPEHLAKYLLFLDSNDVSTNI